MVAGGYDLTIPTANWRNYVKLKLKLFAIAAFAVASSAATAQEKLRIGTASLGGGFYPKGGSPRRQGHKAAEGD